MFCNVLEGKLYFIPENRRFQKRRKFGIFRKGLVHGFWSKIGNFVVFRFCEN